MDGLKIWQDGHIGHVRLNLPPHNFFSWDLIDALLTAFRAFDDDPDCRVTLLSAEGRSFCAGADFGSPRKSGPNSGPGALYERAVELFSLKKPMVAAVQGPAIGGGLGLALVADFRVAARAARFSANFTRLGFHPGFGLTCTLPRLVGAQMASELIMTGRRIDGAAAAEIGLADHLADDDALMDRAEALAAEIAMGAPRAVQDARATLRASLYDDVRAALKRELACQLDHFKTADFQEGIAATRDRRTPEFTGR